MLPLPALNSVLPYVRARSLAAAARLTTTRHCKTQETRGSATAEENRASNLKQRRVDRIDWRHRYGVFIYGVSEGSWDGLPLVSVQHYREPQQPIPPNLRPQGADISDICPHDMHFLLRQHRGGFSRL